MIELPEARTIAKDLRKEIIGKTIVDVAGNYTDHKFTFYYRDPNKYKEYLLHKKVTKINDRNYYVEIEIDNFILLMRDGANIRYYDKRRDIPAKSKLLIEFDDGTCLNITTSMYSFISVFDKEEGMKDDKYYNLELNGIGVFDNQFTYPYFKSLINDNTNKLSIKAFLATEQRIPGIGNGVVQDIMFNARLHPKRKVGTLNNDEISNLYHSIVDTLKRMVDANGRNTEKNIYNVPGGYQTILSNKTYKEKCKKCNSEIIKENYLGGSIYYCSKCQK